MDRARSGETVLLFLAAYSRRPRRHDFGNVVNSEGVYAVAGQVDAGGSGVIRIGGVAGVIRFGAHRFVADYPNLRCGPRHAVGFKIG